MKAILRDGLLGMGSPAAGITVSLLAQWEQWLRLVSLALGIAVGVATFISLLQRIRNRK